MANFDICAIECANDLIRSFQHQINLFWNITESDIKKSVKYSQKMNPKNKCYQCGVEVFVRHVKHRKQWIAANKSIDFNFGKEVNVITHTPPSKEMTDLKSFLSVD